MYEPGLQLANTAKKRAAPRLTESARLFILKENKTGEMEKNYECVFSDRRGADRFFCANSALRRGGFLTVSIPTGTGFDVFIVPPVWTECDLTPDALVGRRGGAYEKRPEHFDGRGCALLAERDCDVILMDELGRMELDAHAFRAAVLAVIHSGTPVLGVIKPEHNAFLDEVRAQNGVELFPLTIENREEAPATIAAWYARASREKRA